MAGLTSFQDRTVVITGASSGIGRLLALRLAAAGAQVVLTARRRDQLEAVAEEIRRGGGKAAVRACDVADHVAVAEAASWIRAEIGAVDMLINNAGYGHHRTFLEWPVDDIENMMRVNYLGTVYWTKALLPAMVERGSGWLVFIASVAGRIGVPDESAYVASKFAMVGLAESLSYEIEERGVHVLTVCPGAIRTDFFDDEALARMPQTARRLMAEPEDLVDHIIAAIRRGKRVTTFPRGIAGAYIARALAPNLMRYGVKKSTRRG